MRGHLGEVDTLGAAISNIKEVGTRGRFGVGGILAVLVGCDMVVEGPVETAVGGAASNVNGTVAGIDVIELGPVRK